MEGTKKVAEENDLQLMRLPCFFEARWTQYTAQLFQNIISSCCAIMTYFKESTEPQEQRFLEKLKDYDFLRLMCFIIDVTSLFSRFQKSCSLILLWCLISESRWKDSF